MNPDVYAVIQNGVVVNTILATAKDEQDPQFMWVIITNLSPQPGIGWSFDGLNFTAPESNVPIPTPSVPIQIQVQVADPATQQVLMDILYYQLNNDPSVLQKYVIVSATQQAQPQGTPQ
jgi:hypothetical protein